MLSRVARWPSVKSSASSLLSILTKSSTVTSASATFPAEARRTLGLPSFGEPSPAEVQCRRVFQRHSVFTGDLNGEPTARADRKSTRLNSSHQIISYAVFCLKKKKEQT